MYVYGSKIVRRLCVTGRCFFKTPLFVILILAALVTTSEQGKDVQAFTNLVLYFNTDTATIGWIWSRPQIKKISKHIFCK
jgi:hypothetical protein